MDRQSQGTRARQFALIRRKEFQPRLMTSIGLFETSAQADESTRLVANWVRDEKLDTSLPNSPKIAAGNVVAHDTNGAFKA
jgi:hypothetical protein